MTDIAGNLPTVWIDEIGVETREWRHNGIAAALVRYLPPRRWFGDKGRDIVNAVIVDSAAFSLEGHHFLLAIVELTFADVGAPSRYLVPLGLVNTAPPGIVPLALVTGPNPSRLLIDALDHEQLPSWFLDQLAKGQSLEGKHGRFVWHRHPGWEALLEEARQQPAVIGGAEQSNSSMRYGSALFVKVFRRLRPGENPDEELGRYLSVETAFRRLPRLVGSVAYSDGDGVSSTVALVQEYVTSIGDGWSFALERLAAMVAAGSSEIADGDPVDVHRLGQRTGELHQALAQATADPDFSPTAITASDAEAWQRHTLQALRAMSDQFRHRHRDLSPALQTRITTFLDRQVKLEDQARGFRQQIGQVKTRVHGDYHLGQTLRTPDDDWIIIDFEGEPARTIGERRAMTSPLKDVAGMLRSLSYARGAALRAVPNPAHRVAVGPRLEAWEAASRRAFLTGYRDQVRSSPTAIIPANEEQFQTAVAAWELDKAIYEIAYELNNRPDWLDLPLDALLRSG